MPDFTFELGDIVALNSHHFETDISAILFGGEPQQQSPLMIIMAILPSRQGKGDAVLPSDYKCLWFSAKTQKFQDCWLSAPLIKLISRHKDVMDVLPDLGAQLLFRTFEFEIRKLKTSMSHEDLQEDEKNRLKHITPLLSFVSPVLTVCGYGEILEKDRNPKIHSEANLVKVKWFNMQADKFSETFLPVHCFSPIQDIDNTKLKSLKGYIDDRLYLKIKIGKRKTIIMPQRIAFLGGVYLLYYFDVIFNKSGVECEISDVEILEQYKKLALYSGPLFDFSKGEKPIKSVSKIIEKAVKSKSVIRLKYKNQFGETSVRCLKKLTAYKKNPADKEFSYLTGECLLKSDERNFKIDRIRQIEILDIRWKDVKSSKSEKIF